MLSINIDLDFFTNPKVVRLAGILGPGSEIHLIRLWTFMGKHRPSTGGLDDWSADEVEHVADWRGEKSKMIDAMLRCGLLHQRKNGFYVHDWQEHAHHLVKYEKTSEERKKAANKRWKHEKCRQKQRNGLPVNELKGDANRNAKQRFASSENEICIANAIQCNAVTAYGGDDEESVDKHKLADLSISPSPKPRVVWDGSDFTIPNAFHAAWEKAYPGVNVDREINKAAAWLIANPDKAKKDYARFLNSWLGRAYPEPNAPGDAYALAPELEAWAEDAVAKGLI